MAGNTPRSQSNAGGEPEANGQGHRAHGGAPVQPALELSFADEPAEACSGDDAAGERGLTLLERLDRRQNQVLNELDRLNASIEQLVIVCQSSRQPTVPSAAELELNGPGA